MQLRIIANKQECEECQKYFEQALSSSVGYSISKLYPCRNSNLYRLYIDVTFHNNTKFDIRKDYLTSEEMNSLALRRCSKNH